MVFADDKQSKRVVQKSRESRQKKREKKPKDWVRRVADLENRDDGISGVIRSLVARARACADYRQPFEDEWREAWLAWMQILDKTKKEDKWRSKRFIPMIFQHVEAAHPSVAAAVLGSPEIWDLTGAHPEGRDTADALESLLHWQARGPSRVRPAYIRALWWSLITGTGILDHQWSFETEERLVPVVVDDMDEDGVRYDEQGNAIDEAVNPGAPAAKVKEMHKETVVAEDFPVVRAPIPFDWWFPPNRDEGELTPKYVFYAHPTTVGDILEASEDENHLYDNKAVVEWLDEAKDSGLLNEKFGYEYLDENLDLNMYEEMLTESGYLNRENPEDTEEGPVLDKPVTILMYRSKAETFALAPGGRIIGWAENPNAHGTTGIVVHNHYEIPGSWYGRGLATILLPHQELVNENVNRAMDVAEVSLMAPIGVDRSRVSTLDDNFRWKPNSLIRTRGAPKEAVHRLDIPAPTNHALMWDEHLKKDADDTTGFSEQARGIAPQGINTATEFSGLQANLKTRTFMHVERLKETIECSGDLLVQLNQQYMTQEQVIDVIGEDGLYYRTVTPIEIVGKVRVHATVSASKMAPAMKIQQLLGLMQAIVPVLPQIPQNVFLTRLVRQMLVEMDIEDVDRIFPKNFDKVRDPYMENIAILNGVKITPSVLERHDLHIEAHSQKLEEVQSGIESGDYTEQEAADLMQHVQEHMMVAQAAAAQQGAPAQQAGAPGAAPPGGSPERQEAQGLGAAQGSNGQMGAASPGPAAAPGRPM